MAVRPFTVRQDEQKKRFRRRPPAEPPPTWPQHVLIFDTETTTDGTQALLFGAFQLCVWTDGRLKCIDEGLFYADELPTEDPEGFRTLHAYAEGKIRLSSRDEFARRIFFSKPVRT
jgi:hypothetical protein